MANIFTPRPGNATRGTSPQLPSSFPSGLRTPLIILGLAVVAFFLLNPFRIVDEGEVGVKRWLGDAYAVLPPGLNFVVPLVEDVTVFSTRRQIWKYHKVNTYSKDIQAADNLLSVNYRIDPNKALAIYGNYGPNYRETIIDPVIYQRFKEIFGKYDAREIVNQRERLGNEVLANIRQHMPDGIIIDGVQIENIDFSDEYEHAIEAAAQAEAAVRKARQELEQRKVDAEKLVVQANAEAQARVAQATAEANAIKLKGEAEAAAIQARANALRENPNLVTLTATEKWDGKLPTTFVPGSAVPFVTVPRGSQQ